MRTYPVGKTQATVLAALNIAANDFSHAEQIFQDLGLIVTSKRQGRKTIPVVKVLDRQSGAFNAAGEGVIFDKYPDLDTTKIKKWVE